MNEKKVDYNDKITIISRIINLIKREEKTHQPISITQLKGLGKNLWRKTERESWDSSKS